MRNMNSRLSFMGARSDESAIQAARVRGLAAGDRCHRPGSPVFRHRSIIHPTCLPVPCGPARSCPHESNQAPSAEAYRPAEYPTLRVASRACGPRAFGCLGGRASRGGRESRNPSATSPSQRNGASVCAGGPWGSSWQVEAWGSSLRVVISTQVIHSRAGKANRRGALKGHSGAACPTESR